MAICLGPIFLPTSKREPPDPPLHGGSALDRLPLSYLAMSHQPDAAHSNCLCRNSNAPARIATRHYFVPARRSVSSYFLMATVARIPAHRGRRSAHWLDSGQHGPRRPPRRGAVTVMTGSKRAIRTGHADLHPRQIPMTSAATRSAMTIRVPDAMEATRHDRASAPAHTDPLPLSPHAVHHHE